MKLKTFLNIPDYRYNAGTILRWLWQTSRGNRLQAGINAALKIAGVAIEYSGFKKRACTSLKLFVDS